MSEQSEIVEFYQTHVPEAQALPEGEEPPTWLRAQCPFCKGETKGLLNVDLDPESQFFGLFNCSALCSPPGFVLEFCRRMGISPRVDSDTGDELGSAPPNSSGIGRRTVPPGSSTETTRLRPSSFAR